MKTQKERLSRWDRIMMAITFAEAGEAETARDMLRKPTEKQQRPGQQVRKGTATRPRLRV